MAAIFQIGLLLVGSQGAHTGYSNEKMVRNDQKLDEIRLSRVPNRRGGGGGWAENCSFAHTRPQPLVDFAPSRARLDTKQSYLIEFSTVSDHFFIRISSVGSLW